MLVFYNYIQIIKNNEYNEKKIMTINGKTGVFCKNTITEHFVTSIDFIFIMYI